MALIILMCICGFAGCGARRYYAVRRGSNYRHMVSYDSYSNESNLFVVLFMLFITKYVNTN